MDIKPGKKIIDEFFSDREHEFYSNVECTHKVDCLAADDYICTYSFVVPEGRTEDIIISYGNQQHTYRIVV